MSVVLTTVNWLDLFLFWGMAVVACGVWFYLVYNVYKALRHFFRAVRRYGKHTVDERLF